MIFVVNYYHKLSVTPDYPFAFTKQNTRSNPIRSWVSFPLSLASAKIRWPV